MMEFYIIGAGAWSSPHLEDALSDVSTCFLPGFYRWPLRASPPLFTGEGSELQGSQVKPLR